MTTKNLCSTNNTIAFTMPEGIASVQLKYLNFCKNCLVCFCQFEQAAGSWMGHKKMWRNKIQKCYRL